MNERSRYGKQEGLMWEVVTTATIGIVGTLLGGVVGLIQERQRSKAALAQQYAELRQQTLGDTRLSVIESIRAYIVACDAWVSTIRRFEKALRHIQEFPYDQTAEFDDIVETPGSIDDRIRNGKSEVADALSNLDTASALCEILAPQPIATEVENFTAKARQTGAVIQAIKRRSVLERTGHFDPAEFEPLRAQITEATRRWNHPT